MPLLLDNGGLSTPLGWEQQMKVDWWCRPLCTGGEVDAEAEDDLVIDLCSKIAALTYGCELFVVTGKINKEIEDTSGKTSSSHRAADS